VQVVTHLGSLIMQIKNVTRDGFGPVIEPQIMSRARKMYAASVDTGGVAYACFVLLRVMPSLETPELRLQCAATLESQLKSETYTLCPAIWEAVAEAAQTGTHPAIASKLAPLQAEPAHGGPDAGANPAAAEPGQPPAAEQGSH